MQWILARGPSSGPTIICGCRSCTWILSSDVRICPRILPQMTMLPKRQLSRELDPARPSKPLAKRALQSAVASEWLAVIRRSNTWDLDSEGSLER